MNLQYRKFLQKKLWRDNMVAMMEKHGSVMHWRRLTDAEFDAELRIKLVEETEEVVRACTKDELLGECADVLEVLETLADLHGLTLEDIRAAQLKKQHERGGFKGRMFVESADHPVGSFGERYCLADPEKYPELV